MALDDTAGDLGDTIEAEIQAVRDKLAPSHDTSSAETIVEGQAAVDSRLDTPHQAPEGGVG